MSTFVSVITSSGLAKIADSIANGTDIQFSTVRLGDGGGVPIVPSTAMTAMVNQVWSGSVDTVFRDPLNANQIIVQATVPAIDGPFSIREAAIFTADGQMFSIGSYPLTEKPAYGSGAAVDIIIQFYIVVSSAANVTVAFDTNATYYQIAKMRPPFIAVDSFTSTAPPVAPAQGALLVVPAIGASGEFLGQENKFAQFVSSAWYFTEAPLSTIAGAADTMKYYQRVASGWIEIDLLGTQRWGDFTWKLPVRAATTANIVLSGTQTIDGVVLTSDDRVLVKNQALAANNGLYRVSAAAWSRTIDADTSARIGPGMVVYVLEGAVNGSSLQGMTTPAPIILNTTTLGFVRLGPYLFSIGQGALA